jgi:hypothetical protein
MAACLQLTGALEQALKAALEAAEAVETSPGADRLNESGIGSTNEGLVTQNEKARMEKDLAAGAVSIESVRVLERVMKARDPSFVLYNVIRGSTLRFDTFEKPKQEVTRTAYHVRSLMQTSSSSRLQMR